MVYLNPAVTRGHAVVGRLGTIFGDAAVNDAFYLLAEFLVDQPTAVDRLLTRHLDDGKGRCRTCSLGAQRGFQIWPCTLYAAAALAQESCLRAHQAQTG